MGEVCGTRLSAGRVPAGERNKSFPALTAAFNKVLELAMEKIYGFSLELPACRVLKNAAKVFVHLSTKEPDLRQTLLSSLSF